MRPGGSDWLREFLGDERMAVFDKVISVSLSETPVTDDDLILMKELPDLEYIGLSYTKVGERGMEYLTGLTNLKKLDLYRSQVGDEGLKHLSEITSLESLPAGKFTSY